MPPEADSARPAIDSPALSIRDLVVRRGGRTVLHGVNLDVGRGEAFGLLGPNGAGKTTLFHVLTGLLAPSSGSLVLDGRPATTSARAFRARTGVVFQQPALDSQLTARENLRLAARLYGVPAADARRRIDALLERARLADRADEPVRRYSGGMRRRVELARALVHRPSLLILDEPTTGLDEGAYRGFWADLEALRRESGLTLLLTTHRADEAEHCDRLAILDQGRVVACDAPDRLRERVRGDLLILEALDARSVAALIAERFGLEARVLDDRVTVRRERAHELIPRLVEALPDGALRAISLRSTGLGEVFLELTGHALADVPQGDSGGTDTEAQS